ncbi:hypothetical protein LOD99_13431 [Oopsacas minuta]|uniref:non-specific serine/threonine protein kinase n=1 Tax=Oopsacas minuta TaxID=111878 RepID=A0AAV7KKH0_9METZ|nr:hypothetical protein LOD99_13431 [Oopsacas minuta]
MAYKLKGVQHIIGKSIIVENFRVLIDKLLDEGGFSIVYKVHAQDGSEYALKKITTNTRNEFEVYLQEINIMRSLTLNEASNCVKLVAAQSYSGTLSPGSPVKGGSGVHELYLLMELCTSSVHTLMTSKLPMHLTEQIVFEIFHSTCVALLQLHSMETPIIHRDIKIENVLINSKGQYVLCDFGSAYIGTIQPNAENRTEVEDDINKYTTMDYRAPEMINLYSGYEITTKVDIWALGVLLYKLCFRKTPFGDSKFGILSGKFFIPSSPIYSKNIHNLIHILLNPNPVSRLDIHQVLNSVCKYLRKPLPPGLKLQDKEEIDIRHSPENLIRTSKLSTPSNSTNQSTPKDNAAKLKHTSMSTPVLTSVKARSRPRTSIEMTSRKAKPLISTNTPKSTFLAVPKTYDVNDDDDLDQFGMSQFVPHLKANSAQNLRDATDMFGLEPFSTVSAQKSGSKIDLFGAVPFNDLVVVHHEAKRNESYDIGILSGEAGANTRV